MTRITSTDLQRNLSMFREAAKTGPVFVTERGADSIVMVSAELYAKLNAAYRASTDQSNAELTFDRYTDACATHLLQYRHNGHLDRVAPSLNLLERIFTLNILNESTFEIGGYVFMMKDDRAHVVRRSDWLFDDAGDLKPAARAFAANFEISGMLTGKDFRCWSSPATPESVSRMAFLPPLLQIGLTGEGVRQWMTDTLAGSLFNMEYPDMPKLKGRFEDVSGQILTANAARLRRAFPTMQVKHFLEDFGPRNDPQIN
jgi:prevent-host-death family protein